MKKEKTTSSSKTESLSADWFVTHPQSQQRKSLLPVTGDVRDFLNFTWPSSIESYNPLNAVFSMQILHLDLLKSHSTWLFRDGLVPLLWFFRRHPHPGNLQCKIYIHKDLSDFVPEAWRKHMGTYKITSLAQGNGQRKLLLLGTMAEPFMSQKALREFLLQLKTTHGDELKKLEKTALILPKSYGFGTEHDHQYSVDYMCQLCEVFGTNIKALHWRQFESMDHFHGFEVVSLNDGYLLADDFMVNYAASRGARFFQKDQKKSEDKVVRLSAYHGYLLQDELPTSAYAVSDDIKASEKYLRALNSEAHIRMPWPQWFSDWVKTATQLTTKK